MPIRFHGLDDRFIACAMALFFILAIGVGCARTEPDDGYGESGRTPTGGDQAAKVIDAGTVAVGARHVRWSTTKGDVTGVTAADINEYLGESASPSGYSLHRPTVSSEGTRMLFTATAEGYNYGRRPLYFVVIASGLGDITGVYEAPLGGPCDGYPFDAGWVDVNGSSSVLISLMGGGECPGLLLLRPDGSAIWDTPTQTHRPQVLIDPDNTWVALDQSWSDEQIIEFFSLEDPSLHFVVRPEAPVPPDLPIGIQLDRAIDVQALWTPLTGN